MMKFASNRYRFSYLLLGIMVFLFWSFSLPCQAALKVTASNEYKYTRVPDSHFPSDIFIRMYIEQVVISRLNTWHKALVNNDQDQLLQLISSKSIVLKALIMEKDTMDSFYHEYFAFSDEYLIDRMTFYPLLTFSDGNMLPSIRVSASRRALLDKEYRTNFTIQLIYENGNWFVYQYYFPDLVDYIQLNESDWELPNIEKIAE